MKKIYQNHSKKLFLFLLFTSLLYGSVSARKLSAPSFFTYAELTTLYEQETLPQSVEAKLNRLLTIPFVDNSHA
ncbi:MAG: hypothetical protein WKF90_11340, partial [Pyrinomonadaceae bacterium]